MPNGGFPRALLRHHFTLQGDQGYDERPDQIICGYSQGSTSRCYTKDQGKVAQCDKTHILGHFKQTKLMQ